MAWFYLNAPQLIWIVLAIVSIKIHIREHGKPKEGKENVFLVIPAVLIQFSLLYWGGFFSQYTPVRAKLEREAVDAGAAEFVGLPQGQTLFRWINAKEVEDHWFKVGFDHGIREATDILRDSNYLRPVPEKGAKPEYERGLEDGAERVRKLTEDMGIELPAQ